MEGTETIFSRVIRMFPECILNEVCDVRYSVLREKIDNTRESYAKVRRKSRAAFYFSLQPKAKPKYSTLSGL